MRVHARVDSELLATHNMAVTNTTLLASLGQVLYGGINPSIPGHGGADCVAYLSRPLMVVDTSLATFMMIVVMVFALKTYTLPKVIRDDGNPLFKRFLLVFLSVLFGIEICYKICSKQLLYILNPCHVITLVEVSVKCTVTLFIISPQMTLLASKPSKFSYSLLRYLYNCQCTCYHVYTPQDTHSLPVWSPHCHAAS